MNLPDGYDSWDSWADYVLGRFTRMVQKQDYWWGYFNPDECNEEQIEMALMHARARLPISTEGDSNES